MCQAAGADRVEESQGAETVNITLFAVDRQYKIP
jgi:hypothetical protein